MPSHQEQGQVPPRAAGASRVGERPVRSVGRSPDVSPLDTLIPCIVCARKHRHPSGICERHFTPPRVRTPEREDAIRARYPR